MLSWNCPKPTLVKKSRRLQPLPESTEDRTIGGVTAIARPKAVAATSAADGSLSAEVDNRRLQAGCPDHGGAGILPAAILPLPSGANKNTSMDQVHGDANARFCWDSLLPVNNPALLAALAPLGRDFPIGYRSELRTNYAEFFEPLLAALSSGLLLWLDYGFARPEYYHPARHQGTLRTFFRHRAGEYPLLDPGHADISAHVDFTAVAEAAITLGCRPLAFRNQGAWLTETGRDWLLAMEGQPDASLLRQFTTLTHPAQLGSRFHLLELSWNNPAAADLPAADCHRLALGGGHDMSWDSCPSAGGYGV